MSSTLTCVRNEGMYECKLITDGKRIGDWKVKSVEVESEEGKEISSEIETSLISFIATTDDYFNCQTKDNKLLCVGTLKSKTVHKSSSFIEKLLSKV